MKLPFLQIRQEDIAIFILASKEIRNDNSLIRILTSPEYKAAKKSMSIAHPIGFDVTGDPVITDLALYPHLIVCGTTGSGKSVALKSLLMCLTRAYPPHKINLIICDKAGDLCPFAKSPNLSYPIIKDVEIFLKVMLILKNEMERRIKIKKSDEFSRLPAIVCVVDEFLAFISGTDNKKNSKLLRDTVSDILRRGRHARIHMVLAAHNPTKQNMSIDTSSIPSKMVFRVATFTNSVTVLGERGAEKLTGKGDMLFQSSQSNVTQCIQGANISEEEIEKFLKKVHSHYDQKFIKQNMRKHCICIKYKFLIKETDLKKIGAETSVEAREKNTTTTQRNMNDALLIKVCLWALEHKVVSCNKIIKTFKVGWQRADGLLEQLYELGIVEDIYKKLPRKVLPAKITDISEKAMDFLSINGVSVHDVAAAIQKRNHK